MENNKDNEKIPKEQENRSMIVEETIETICINKEKDMQTVEKEGDTEQLMQTTDSKDCEEQNNQQGKIKEDMHSSEHGENTEQSMEVTVSNPNEIQIAKDENVDALREQTNLSHTCDNDKDSPAEKEPMATDKITKEPITTNPESIEETCAKVIEDIVVKEATTSELNEIQTEETQRTESESTREMRPIKTEPVEIVPNPAAMTRKRNSSKAEAVSGLGLLAQYNSDEGNTEDENDEENAQLSKSPVIQELDRINYRDMKVEILSSDSESDSDSDSSIEVSQMLKIINKNNEDDEDDDDDEEGAGNNAPRRRRQPPRVKGEMLLDDLPPIEDLHITVPEEECKELGTITSIVEQLVLVSALPNCELLDLQTVLFLDKGKHVLGEIFDVIGQVTNPLYCVRFNSRQQIDERGISIGDVVYVAPKTEYTQFVVLANLMRVRGSDASWENDIEPPPRYLDFSDDEQERAARAKRRNKDRRDDAEQQDANDDNDDASKRGRVITVNSDHDSGSEAGDQVPHRRGEHMPATRGRRGRFRGRPNAENTNYHHRQQDMYAPRPPMRSWPPRPQFGYGMPPANPFYNMYNPAMQQVGMYPTPPPPQPPTQQFQYGAPSGRRGGRPRHPPPMYNAPMFGPPVYVMNPFAFGGAANVPTNAQQATAMPAPPPPAPPGAE